MSSTLARSFWTITCQLDSFCGLTTRNVSVLADSRESAIVEIRKHFAELLWEVTVVADDHTAPFYCVS